MACNNIFGYGQAFGARRYPHERRALDSEHGMGDCPFSVVQLCYILLLGLGIKSSYQYTGAGPARSYNTMGTALRRSRNRLRTAVSHIDSWS
jgi:hypothetical protein